MSSGLISKLAAVQGSTWGTAVSLTTNHRKPFKSCTFKHRTERIPDDTITGKATRAKPGAGGNLVVDGGFVAQADYRQNELFIAAILAAAASPGAASDTSAYTHVLPFTDDQAGKFLTIGHDAGGKRVEILKSVKLNRWLFEARSGQVGEDTFDGLGRGVDDSGASSGWTYEYDPSGGGGRGIYLSQGVIRVNAESGGSLGSGDVILPARFAMELRRNLTQDYAQAAESEEPLPSTFADIEVMLDFFALTTALKDLFREAHQNRTALKMDAVFTGAELAGASTVYHARKLYFPSLEVLECPLDTPGPGPVPCTVRMSAHHASAVPTGFPSGYDEAMTVVLINKRSAAILS
jgi:hypothetical protein